ncbi:MAG: steroid 3-ketoacyl-CoA thiolase, partial [Acidimicrobiales bacterium]
REDLDQIACDSQMRAHRATEEGRFEAQIVPIEVKGQDGPVILDGGIRPSTTIEILGGLKPVFKEDGVITAGNSSQITDGAAAVLIMSETKARGLGLAPRATFKGFSVVGTDPVTMLAGPIPATEVVLTKAGLSIEDIGLFEINEAFASVVGAWLHETGVDWNRVNVNGGAIALGHP